MYWTCSMCGQQVQDHQYDAEERMCDECLNHEDEYAQHKGFETGTIYYQEDILNNIKKLIQFVKKVKPQDHYVRGFEDSRMIMLETLDIITNIIKEK